MNSLPSAGYVFISYARKDASARQRILDAMRERRIPVWIDAEKLQAGTPNWERNIEQAIKGCGAVAVLLSPAASGSDWVRHEITYAEHHRKNIIPVIVDGDAANSIPIRLINHQYINLTRDWNSGLAQLAEALRGYSQSELEKMKAQAEVAAREEAARRATIRAAEEKAAREVAVRLTREKEQMDREAAIRSAQEEARRFAEQRIAQEEARRQAAEAARLKAALREATREDNESWKTSSDRLWVAISYVFTPLVPLIILLSKERRNRPFIRAHNAQALGLGIISAVISFGFSSLMGLLSVFPSSNTNSTTDMVLGVSILALECLFCSVPFMMLALQTFWGIQAYRGKYIEIPALTKFIKKMGWA